MKIAVNAKVDKWKFICRFSVVEFFSNTRKFPLNFWVGPAQLLDLSILSIKKVIV